MKKYLKPILAFAIVFMGCVFLKIGDNDNIWLIIIGSLGTLITAIPAFFWYNDKLNM